MHPAVELQPLLLDVIKERAAGGLIMPPKQGIHLGPGHFFHAMTAASPAKGVAVCKWIGLAPDTGINAHQQSHSTILLSELATGRLLHVLDAGPITLNRTVALSLAAFSLSGKPAPASVGFIAGGRQAQGHLEAFLEAYPGIRDVYLYEARPRGAAAFDRIASRHGAALHISASPDPVLAASQVLVTTVPGTSTELAFLDMSKTREDVFVCGVDLGRSWTVHSVQQCAPFLLTDDLPQTRELIAQQAFPLPLDFAADLPALAAGGAVSGCNGRILFAFPGNAYADLAGAIGVVGQGLALPPASLPDAETGKNLS